MNEAKVAMTKAVEFLRDQLRGLYLTCITPHLIDTVRITYYDQQILVKYIAECVHDATGISIKPYNPNDVGLIANALKAAGFEAYPFSKTAVHVSVPKFITSADTDRFKSHVKKLGEEAKVAIRNVRKNARQGLTKEELKLVEKDLQKLTDEMIAQVEELVHQKINMR